MIGTIGSVFVSKIVFITTRSNSIKAEQDVAAIRIHKKFIFQIQRHYDVIHKIYQFQGHFCSLICYFKNLNIQTLKAQFTQYHQECNNMQQYNKNQLECQLSYMMSPKFFLKKYTYCASKLPFQTLEFIKIKQKNLSNFK